METLITINTLNCRLSNRGDNIDKMFSETGLATPGKRL
jgi:hypothetical protein